MQNGAESPPPLDWQQVAASLANQVATLVLHGAMKDSQIVALQTALRHHQAAEVFVDADPVTSPPGALKES